MATDLRGETYQKRTFLKKLQGTYGLWLTSCVLKIKIQAVETGAGVNGNVYTARDKERCGKGIGKQGRKAEIGFCQPCELQLIHLATFPTSGVCA